VARSFISDARRFKTAKRVWKLTSDSKHTIQREKYQPCGLSCGARKMRVRDAGVNKSKSAMKPDKVQTKYVKASATHSTNTRSAVPSIFQMPKIHWNLNPRYA
jgi:hypothetical protein